MTSTDRIEKNITLRAPLSRVWKALTTVGEFNEWFGAKLAGVFEPGATLKGNVTACGHEHLTMELTIERVEPERRFSYRWHPYAVDPSYDYSSEPTTLVEFTLEPDGEGTRLTVVESGFDRIPASRRAKALEMNSGGWAAQLENIARHVGRSS